MDKIVNHKKEDTVYDKADSFVTNKYGNKSRPIMTKG